MTTYSPLYEQVMMKPVEAEKVSKGGILVWEQKNETVKSEIISFGPDVPAKVFTKGDFVFHDRHVAHKVEIDWEKFLLIPWKELKVLERKSK